MAWIVVDENAPTPVNDELNEEVQIVCAFCDNIITEDEKIILGEKSACQKCANNSSVCAHCVTYFHEDDMFNVNGEGLMCEDCHSDNCTNCESCGDDYATTACEYTDDGLVCPQCYESRYFCCNSCGVVFHNDNYGDDGYCNNCNDAEDYAGEGEGSPYIHAYDADPFDYADNSEAVALDIKNNPTLPFLGVELEVAVDNSLSSIESAAAAISLAVQKMCIIKHDGSITYGFEITSLPMLIDEHRKYDGWQKIFNEIASKHLHKRSVDKCCGIHIHINRGAFTQVSLTRFVAFIHSRYNEQFIKLIAERVSAQYCAVTEKDPTIHLSNPNEKYQAVNLAKDKTIEVRIFASILDEARFFKNIEFVQALYEYCLALPVSKGQKLSWETENPKSNPALRNEAFMGWLLEGNTEKFPALVGFLKSNILKPNKMENKAVAVM